MLGHQKPLTIIQYNTNNSRNGVLLQFLQEAEQADPQPDVLAIQEPWRSNQGNTTCTTKSYHLVHAGVSNTRVCFYVNKAIDINKWAPMHHSADACTVKLEGRERTIQIHNIYNPQQTNSSLRVLPELLRAEGEHILLGDFNLHHPFWGGCSSNERRRRGG
jgi:exonuclease III